MPPSSPNAVARPSAPILELREFQIEINKLPLFEAIDLSIAAGEVLLITGPNGAGKSSLMRCISGKPYQVRGHMQRSMSLEQIVYQSQSHNLSFHLPLSIGDVIKTGTGIQDEQIYALGLVSADLERRSWNTASGGERQRALISRSLLLNPTLLLLDEPFNHLDQANVEQTLKMMKHRQDKRDFPAIIMTAHGHNIDMMLDAFNPKVLHLQPSAPLQHDDRSAL